jgi:hypothetical protein
MAKIIADFSDVVDALEELEKASKKPSSLINRAELRRRMTQYAKDTRYNFKLKGLNIRESTFATGEAVLWNWAKRLIDLAPSRGKTI